MKPQVSCALMSCFRRSAGIVAALVLFMGPALGLEVDKYSSDTHSGYPNPPISNDGACNGQAPQVSFQNFDAGRGDTSEKIFIRGELFVQGDAINGTSMVLECPNGSALPAIANPAVTPVFPQGVTEPVCAAVWPSSGYLEVPIANAMAAAPPDTWCTLLITAGTKTWHFPNAWRKDTVPPTVAVPGAAITHRVDPTPNGRATLTFYVDAANNEFNDPDGVCENSGCNRTPGFFGAEVFLKPEGGAYTTPRAGITANGQTDFQYLGTALTTKNRNDPTQGRYCYALRLLDTAGNKSGLSDPLGFDGAAGGGDDVSVAGSARPRCFHPDGKPPQVTKVEVYHDPSLTAKVAQTTTGVWVVNRTESEAPLGQKDGVVYVKVYFSEPLFDPQAAGNNRYGSPAAMKDGFDNDNDGAIDEELPNGVDDDADGLIDEDLRITGCTPSAAVAGDGKDNDCDGYIDEDNAGGADPGTGVVCTSRERLLYTDSDGLCVPLPQYSVLGADVDGTLLNQLLTFNSTPTTFQSMSESVYVFAYNISNIDEDDDYVMKFTMTDGVGNVVTDTLPLATGVLRVDNTPPTYEVSYYRNATLTEKAKELGTPVLPTAPKGDLYLRIEANEEVRLPVFAINQPGTVDVTEQATVAVTGSATITRGLYAVQTADGGSYLDGTSNITVKGKDLAGNWTGGGVGSYILPTEGNQFRIDTLPPNFQAIAQDTPPEKGVAKDVTNKPTNSPALKWINGDPDGVNYQVQIATNKTFSGSAIIRNALNFTTQYPAGSMADNAKDTGVCATNADCDENAGFECETSLNTCRQYYYWRIAPSDSAGNVAEFTDCQDPPACTVRNPFRFRVDAEPPKLSVAYFKNFDGANFSNPLQITALGLPVAVSGTIRLKITSNEQLGALPTFSVLQPGSSDALNQPVTVVVSGSVYAGSYQVVQEDGLNFQDGTASVTYTATDTSGNTTTNALMVSGTQFLIDTKPPVVTGFAVSPDPASLGPITLTVNTSEAVNNPFTGSLTGACLGQAGNLAFNYVEGSQFTYTASYTVVDDETACPVTSNVTVTDFANQLATGQTLFQLDSDPPDLPTPFLLGPPDNTNVANPPSQNLTPTFEWAGVSGAVLYHLEVATAPDFLSENIIIDRQDLTGTTFTPAEALPNPDATYHWRVRPVDLAGNKSKNPPVFLYITDNTPPAAPTFSPTVPSTTTEEFITVSGTTEPLASVQLFRDGLLVQVVTSEGVQNSITADNTGNFTFSFDNDGDGQVNEDAADGVDNDGDDQVDEDTKDFALNPGQNLLTAKAIDRAGNEGQQSDPPKTVSLDQGPPTFTITYFLDALTLTPVPIGADGLPQVGAGSVFLKITSNELLQNDQCTFSVDQPGTSDTLNAVCALMPGKDRVFLGEYVVSANDGGAHLDGETAVTVTATDLDGNKAQNATPLSGRSFRIDTSGPQLNVSVYEDAQLTKLLPRDTNLRYVANAKTIYFRVASSETLGQGTVMRVDQPGASDENRPLSSFGGSSTVYIVSYSVHTDDGSTFQDGVANLTFTGQDLAGNDFEEILPATGATFAIDTLPPGKPVLILPSNTTLFSEMNVAVTGEPFSTATLRVSRQFIDATVNPDDGLDNDGDGRSDEEPGGRNGLDDDRDGFVDEDYSDNLCGLDEFLNQGACTIPTLDKRPSFSRQLNDIGSATITVTLGLGKNIVTGRLKDLAGNTGLASDPVTITNNAPQQLQLDHTFAQAGWQAVSIPMVPNFLSPIQGFQLNTDFLSVAPPLYRSGKQVAVMSPGVGYWVNVPAANTEVTMYGQTSKTKVLSLTKGWNLIGPPYNQVIPWNANIGVSQDINLQNQFSLTSTEAAALLHPNAYRYNPTTKTYDTLTPGSGNLSPFQGYFVLAFKDCQLILPDPP